MPNSLDTLALNLKNDIFKTVKKFFWHRFDMMIREGVYPQDCTDDPAQKTENQENRTKDEFFS